jgi:hypothetical protein
VRPHPANVPNGHRLIDMERYRSRVNSTSAGRVCTSWQSRRLADSPVAHRPAPRTRHSPVRRVHILVACQPLKHRLAQQPRQPMPTVLTGRASASVPISVSVRPSVSSGPTMISPGHRQQRAASGPSMPQPGTEFDNNCGPEDDEARPSRCFLHPGKQVISTDRAIL